MEGKENQDRNCGWKGGGGGSAVYAAGWKQREEKKINLKVEKKEKEEQRHGSAPGAAWQITGSSEPGPYSCSPPQSGPDQPPPRR